MMLICKSDNDSVGRLKYLTIDSAYNILDSDDIGYLIKDDIGEKRWFCKDRFYTIGEVRDIRLKKLGI